MPQGTGVPPSQWKARIKLNYVYNSATCFCGYYLVYAACGHMWRREPEKCVHNLKQFTHPFCLHPVPVRQCTSFYVNQNCDQCGPQQPAEQADQQGAPQAGMEEVAEQADQQGAQAGMDEADEQGGQAQ
ncbi:hypothetical protein F5883DRAFT_524449 [Diaporthe sp. PMI_573]|nr:hypothetical protein F5883DRAFT_524449 [Diaporthaceae sp. PMI_573]